MNNKVQEKTGRCCLRNYDYSRLQTLLLDLIHQMGYVHVGNSDLVDWLMRNEYTVMSNRDAGYLELYLGRLSTMLWSTRQATLYILALLRLEDDISVAVFMQDGLGVWSLKHRQTGEQQSVFLPVEEDKMKNIMGSIVSLAKSLAGT